jgi:Sulfotransferase family
MRLYDSSDINGSQCADNGLPCRSPVFILTASRSGSTLLRFILDSHPELACPAETSVASACRQLIGTLDVLETAGSGQSQSVMSAASPSPTVLASVRSVIDAAYGRYLRRRGKRRWCDKSLDTYQFAEIMAQIYPEARFICLYRHCMDVIASGVETCPWGLHRYGFDPFVAQNPGNSVAAISSYWLACAQAVMAFEEAHQESCHRVRYEDLVTEPEQTVAAIFSFLDVKQVPGITGECFLNPHEGEGPGDEKIWFTTEVSAQSLGRGVTVPAGAMPLPIRQAVNELLVKLDYRLVDDEWNNAIDRVDPRVHPDTDAATDASIPADAPVPADGRIQAYGHATPDRVETGAAVRAIRTRMESVDDSRRHKISAHWPTVAGSTVTLVVRSAGGVHEELRSRFESLPGTDGNGSDEPVAMIIASPATWQSLLTHQTNLVTEMTSGRLRCQNKRDAYRIRSDELHAVAELLGLAQIPVARTLNSEAPAAPQPARQPTR